mgnify:FL=1
MNTIKKLMQQVKENAIGVIFLIGVIAFIIYVVHDSIQDMQHATTNYDYCSSLCRLIEFSGKVVTWCIYAIVIYLTYIQKQYTKWILWLYYIVVASFLIYYFVAHNTLEFVLNHIEAGNIDKLPSMARSLYGGPVYFMLFSFLFIPKLIKDTIKLKKEQDLTV